MDAPATYLHFGFILLSIPNLIILGIMIGVFLLALFAPFPGHGGSKRSDADG